MNILHLINHAGSGGSEKYIEMLTESFSGGEICFAYNEDGPLREKMVAKGVNSVKIGMRSPFDIGAARQVAKLCKQHKIGIIHTHFLREAYVAVLSKLFNRGVKVVYTYHILERLGFGQKAANWLFMRFCDAVIAVCKVGRASLIENKIPPKKIAVIYNGAPKVEKCDTDFRGEFGIAADDFVFVTVTRLSPEKGVDFLLRSVEKLAADMPYKLVVVGDGPLLEQMQQYASQNNLRNVIFTGKRADVGAILQQSNCFINSSQTEALSFAIVEALSHKLPVVATKVGGNVEIVNEETNCGIAVDYGDEDALARAMQKMMQDENFRETCSDNALKLVAETFNAEKMLKETFNIYEKISN